MFNNEPLVLPCQSPNWTKVARYIAELFDNYERINSISDVISTLRDMKDLLEEARSLDRWQDSFFGLGLFLELLPERQLRSFIANDLRNVLRYVHMNERLADTGGIALSHTNNVIRVSLAAGKSLLACAVVCLLPHRFACATDNNERTTTISFDDLFKGINFGSKNHIQLLHNILQYFSTFSKDLVEKESNTFITISLQKSDSNSSIIDESHIFWPIILTANLSTASTTQILANLWPTCFEDINPPNYLNHLQNKSNRSFGDVCPILVLILPLLTFGFADFLISDVINITWDKIQHALYRILPVDHWNVEPQYSLECITTNMLDCLQGFQCLLEKYQPNRTQFASNLTNSVIEDAIHKLNMTKSREIFALNRSISNILDSRKVERPSLANIFFNSRRPREASMSSTSTSSRSGRQSYSTTSSSRSGSLQLSTFSSRRSSNISNKDPDYSNNAMSEKTDFTSHVFHPIILEESNIQVEDDTETDCLLLPFRTYQDFSSKADFPQTEILFDQLMCAPISDSTKLSLSKDYLHLTGDKSPQAYFSRRNSSPTLSSLTSKDTYKTLNEMRKIKIKSSKRCCEEDASNDRLAYYTWSRSKNQGRRQSLPCHLQWVYQLPLTDTVKLNLSQTHILKNETSEHCDNLIDTVISKWSTDFLQNKIIVESENLLKKLLKLADNIILNILPDEAKKQDQLELRNDILKYRSRTVSESSSEEDRIFKVSSDYQMIFVTQNESLHSNDLATFDKELYSSTFFDNEALQYFRQLSRVDVPNKDQPESNFTIGSDDNNEEVGNDYKQANDNGNKIEIGVTEWNPHVIFDRKSLIDYANELTDVIITEAITEEKSCPNLSSYAKFSQYADTISVDIIANTLVELASTSSKEEFKVIPPIYIGPLPSKHNSEIGTLMQIVASCVSQSKTGRTLVLVCDNAGNSVIPEIIDIIQKHKDHLTPYQMYNIMIQYCTDKELRSRFQFKDFLLKILTE